MSAHVGITDDPAELNQKSVRGQLVQRFQTSLTSDEVVKPDLGKSGATGNASIRVQDAGKMLCIDATISNFDPKVATLQLGKAGTNGDIVSTFSGKRLSKGRFLGCVVSSADLAAKILDKPTDYYLLFRQDVKGSGNYNNAIRGNLDPY